MKKNAPFLFIMLLGIGLLASCAKKPDAPPAATFTSAMSATVNGNNWTATSVTGSSTSGVVEITGTGANNSGLVIELNSSATGNYTIPSSGAAITYVDATGDYISTTGTITITSSSNN